MSFYKGNKDNIKTGPMRLKQLTKKVNIRTMSQKSILYFIRHASVILSEKTFFVPFGLGRYLITIVLGSSRYPIAEIQIMRPGVETRI